MRFNIVIPFYKNYDTIEHLLLSIEDQDYRDFDVTIVIDGPDEKAQKQLEGYLEDGKFKFNFHLEVLPKNSGASAARNFGAKMAVDNLLANPIDGGGSAFFFVDADCKLMPGILTDFNFDFDEFPDVDFLYGNYRYELDKPAFISQDFDPYLLETMNYVPTMSPIRREAFQRVNGFDDRKYFQDWGLFYKMVKGGSTGKYMGKNYYVFSTTSPTEDNISGTQGLTLAEKAAEFREYYEIKDKDLVVTTWGAPLQAIQRAKMLNADYVGAAKGSDRMVFPVNYEFKNWKATYVVGVYNETVQALGNHLGCVVGHPIYHFIGTDVFHMITKHSIEELKQIRKMFKDQNASVLVNSSRCQEELKDCGIEAKLVFTPIFKIEQYQNLKPLPEQFTVAVYVSGTNKAHRVDGAHGLSNIPLILEVADALPHIKFKLFGIEQVREVKDNVEFVGRIPEEEMPNFINECSMILRSTIHDGFPQLPIQFMLCGRNALVSCPDKEMKFASRLDFEDILEWEKNKSELIDKISALSTSEDYPNPKEVQEYYSKLLDPTDYWHNILDEYEGYTLKKQDSENEYYSCQEAEKIINDENK